MTPLKHTCCLVPILRNHFGIKTTKFSHTGHLKSSQEAVPKAEVMAGPCLPSWTHCHGVPTVSSRPSAARHDPIHGGAEPPVRELCKWGSFGSGKHLINKEFPLPPGQEIREEKPGAVWFLIMLTPAAFLLPGACILVHRWATAKSKAFARAALEEQKCSWGSEDVLSHCIA